jgi:hypothetical protein
LRKLWTYYFLFSSPFCMKCIEFTTCTYNFNRFKISPVGLIKKL